MYFEANDPTPDELVSENQTDTTYDPGTLEYSTHYYWQIVAWDEYGLSTEGIIWDFTTSSYPNDPPNSPSNPLPENGTIGVDIEVVLSWNCSDPDGDDIVYDIYFEADDSTPDILVADNQIETTFYPGTLEYNTIYYWQIIAIDEHSATTNGPIWHFKTVENMPPDMPSIYGPDKGKPGATYEYGFTSVDPEGYEIAEYIVNWDDGSDEEIIVGPFESGEEAFASHSWDTKGTYVIQGKAKDVYGAESNWSEFEVSIPRNRATSYLWYHWFWERFPLLEKLLSLLL